MCGDMIPNFIDKMILKKSLVLKLSIKSVHRIKIRCQFWKKWSLLHVLILKKNSSSFLFYLFLLSLPIYGTERIVFGSNNLNENFGGFIHFQVP